jgi:transmembrane sensor
MYSVNAMKISEETALQAAEWFFRLQAPAATQTEEFACQAWRKADPSHEYAWQRAITFSQKLEALPKDLTYTTLLSNQQANRRRAMKTLVVLMTMSGAGWQVGQSDAAKRYLAEYATRIGEQRKIIMADGTEIHLNTASAVNTKFDDEVRRIEIDVGEVLIHTGKQDARPMLITTAFGDLQPLGTRFVVKQAAKHTGLSVIEGAVSVTTKAGDQRVVYANQTTSFNQHAIGSVSPIDANSDSWTRGLLVVREMRLAEFATELARYRPGIIRCAPAVADLKISGAFQVRDTNALLASLPSMLPVKVEYLSQYWVMLGAIDES